MDEKEAKQRTTYRTSEVARELGISVEACPLPLLHRRDRARRRPRPQGQARGSGRAPRAGTARTAIERLGAEVEELRQEDEKRYVDMTPAIFVLAAVAMAVRYISLGLDDQSLYILAGLGFALMYGLRPFFFKMQRPKD